MAPQPTEGNAKAVIYGIGIAISLGSSHIVGLLSLCCKELWDSVLGLWKASISAVVGSVAFLTGILNPEILVEAAGSSQELQKSRMTKHYGESYQTWNTSGVMNSASYSPKITTQGSSTNQWTPGKRLDSADVEMMTIIFNQNLCRLQGRHPDCLQCIATSPSSMKSVIQDPEQSKMYSKRQKESVVDLIAVIQYLTFEMTRTPQYAINQKDAVVCMPSARYPTAENGAHDSEAAKETTTGDEIALFGNDLVVQNEVFSQVNDGYPTGKVNTRYTGWAEQTSKNEFSTETKYREDWITMNEKDKTAGEDEKYSDTCPLTHLENGNLCETMMSETDKYTQHLMSKKKKKKKERVLFRTLKRIFCSCSQPKKNSSWRQVNCQEEIETLIQMTARDNAREEKFAHEN